MVQSLPLPPVVARVLFGGEEQPRSAEYPVGMTELIGLLWTAYTQCDHTQTLLALLLRHWVHLDTIATWKGSMIDRLACGSILHQLPNIVSQLLDSHPTLPEAKFGPLQAGILLDRGTVVFNSLVSYFASYIADTELLQYLHLTSVY